MRVIVTGGAGFIGSALVRHLIQAGDCAVLNLDSLTYAGNLDNVAAVAESDAYSFAKADIRDRSALEDLFRSFRPDAIMHLAAESHVDRSIDQPGDFISTNIDGTYNLLETARRYLATDGADLAQTFRFLHVSTDEVFGSLGETGHFNEETPYRPNSPYSASKAASDHLVRAWHETFGLPVLITNCSNNYGPYQFPEKLIPLMIAKGLNGEPMPVYGTGENVRDWLFVEDHAGALATVLRKGRPGETYAIGGDAEKRNIDLVRTLCKLLDEARPDAPHGSHEKLITFVDDRPGHDHRYAIDASKIKRELGWAPTVDFETGLKKTVAWYLENQDWCDRVAQQKYQGQRLGQASPKSGL